MRHRLVAAAGLLLAIGVLPATAQTTLQVNVASRSVAGSTVEVQVSGAVGDTVLLAIITGYGTTVHELETSTGPVSFRWTPTEAGDASIVAVSGDASVTARVEVVPAPEALVASTTVAPERVVVGSGRPLTVVAFLADPFGNPVEDGRRAEMSLVYPDGRIERNSAAATAGLVVAEFPVGAVDGSGQAVASVDAGASSAGFDIVPGGPRPFTLTLGSPVPPADGRSRLVVTTDRLEDGGGNVIADGTSGVIEVGDEAGRIQIIPVRVVAGRITVEIAAPSQPGRISVVGRVAGVASSPLEIGFGEVS